jgi:hypothetical protein
MTLFHRQVQVDLRSASLLLLRALAVAWLVLLWIGRTHGPDPISDTYTYWFSAQPGVDPYGREWSLERAAYIYPPPFLQAITPVARALEWPAFHAVWTAGLMLGVLWIAGPLLGALLLLPIRGWPVWEALIWGNIEIPMAAALVLGTRWSAAWSFPALTKITPAVGMLWHASRNEWRTLIVGIAVTGSIAFVSFAADPPLWGEWVSQVTSTTYRQPYAAPLWLRVGLAGVLVVLGGRTNRTWTLPVAVVVAHPAVWLNSLAIPILWAAAVYRRRLRDPEPTSRSASRLARSME